MNSEVQIRLLTHKDLAFAHALRAQVGWNQTYADWERFLATQPDGCFLAESAGQPVGTATTTIYGPELAWIGMVIVDPAQRRRGFGRALLQHGLRFLAHQGVTGIKLDATPAGKPVYEALGFVDEWTLTRWRRPAIRERGNESPSSVARTSETQSVIPLPRSFDAGLAPLDRDAFGIDRLRVLESLRGQSEGRALVAPNAGGGVAAYGLRRPGSTATYLGPLVARSPATALAIAEELLRDVREAVIWDLPDAQVEAREFARAQGFVPERHLTRMVRGTNACPGDPAKIFGLAGPEIG